MILPRYPIYVPSKGRADRLLTARFLLADGVPFQVVVEPHERDDYMKVVGAERVLVLPFRDLGLGSVPARNWIWEHAKSSGSARHWVLDDNIRSVFRLHRGKRLRCASGPAFAAVEDFVDRYENIAVAGMNYETFCRSGDDPPYRVNVHVYSCMLLDTTQPFRWRGRYNEDTDLCLQVLAAGLCTVLTNVFLIGKIRTGTMRGGNTDSIYQGDGRLRMARSLERVWPGVVDTRRRFGRPQHVVKAGWRGFDTPLKLKPGIDLAALPPNEYGLALRDERRELDELLGDA